MKKFRFNIITANYLNITLKTEIGIKINPVKI